VELQRGLADSLPTCGRRRILPCRSFANGESRQACFLRPYLYNPILTRKPWSRQVARALPRFIAESNQAARSVQGQVNEAAAVLDTKPAGASV
jgi:hypothetical protein